MEAYRPTTDDHRDRVRRLAHRPTSGRAHRAARRVHRVRPAVDGPLPAGLPATRRRSRRQPGGGAADAHRRRHRAGRGPAGARSAVGRLGSAAACSSGRPWSARWPRCCARSPHPAALLVVWRFVQGASGGGGIVLARAIAADVASGRCGRPPVLAVHDGVERRADRGAGARWLLLAATGSWRPMFWLLAVVSLVLAAATWRLIPETLPVERRHARWAAADRAGVRRSGPRPGVRRLRADGRLRLRLAVRLHLRFLVRTAGPLRADPRRSSAWCSR